MELDIKALTSSELEEFKSVIRLFEEVFEMDHFDMPSDHHLSNLLAKDSFFVVAASIEDKIVGALTGYTIDQYYSEKPLAYIYDLAVSNEFHRQGIGRRIALFFKEFCKRNGYQGIFVQADREDQYVLDFYRSLKPTEETSVIDFTYML